MYGWVVVVITHTHTHKHTHTHAHTHTHTHNTHKHSLTNTTFGVSSSLQRHVLGGHCSKLHRTGGLGKSPNNLDKPPNSPYNPSEPFHNNPNNADIP